MILEALRTHSRGTATLVEDPLAPLPQDIFGYKVSRDFTDVLPLHRGLEAVYAVRSSTKRKHIRRGRRRGVVSRLGLSLDDFSAYYAIYSDSLRRWGERVSSRYSWRLFESLHAAAAERRENIALWLAEIDGKTVSGLLIFYWNRRAVCWHSATSDEGLRDYAYSVLVADAIDDAARRGLDWFDFNPSGGHEGVVYFKRQFGTERMPMRILSCETILSRGLRAIKNAA